MEAVTLNVDKDHAKELLQQYRSHRDHATPDDIAVMRAYREISKGGVIIQAYESIRRAGFGADGLPRLAIIRANFTECFLDSAQETVEFRARRWARYNYERERIDWPGLPQFAQQKHHIRAIVPTIPLHLRPKKNLRNYHILWEAEWSRVVPRDPFLLRKLSGDLWLVLAQWDLTDVERAVLATRVSSS